MNELSIFHNILRGSIDPVDPEHVAKARLWRACAGTVAITHQDPSTEVTVRVTDHSDTVYVNFEMRYLRDTLQRNRRMPGTFIHRMVTRVWPGYKAARLALVGAWTSYMIHETLELVRPAGPDVCHAWERYTTVEREDHAWHPHGSPAIFAQSLVENQFNIPYDVEASRLALTSTIGVVMGFDVAEGIMANGRDQAERELATEADVIANGGEWQ